jgi:hypothetical protein
MGQDCTVPTTDVFYGTQQQKSLKKLLKREFYGTWWNKNVNEKSSNKHTASCSIDGIYITFYTTIIVLVLFTTIHHCP